jgi:hypothetical protein
LQRLVELLAREFHYNSFAEDSQNAFKGLHSHLASVFKPLVEALSTTEWAESTSVLLSGWHTVLTLGLWIGIKGRRSFM